MASTQIKRRIGTSIPINEDANKKKSKVDYDKDTEKARRKSASSCAAPSPKKPKHENDARHFKFMRKRSHSLACGNGKYIPLHKRRKKEGIIPPTKFLLGGNIYDPLNLNSLQDEEINRAVNAVTPRSSPLPTPRHRKEEIQVLIPPNITDPLNLAAGEDGDNFELKLVSPKKRKARRRNKKHISLSPSGEMKEDPQASPSHSDVNVASSPPETSAVVHSTKTEACDNIPDDQELQEVELEELSKEQEERSPKEKKSMAGKKTSNSVVEERKAGGNNRKVPQENKDKIVSPVVPQPGARKRLSGYGRSTSRVDSFTGTECWGEGRGGGGGDAKRCGGKPPSIQGAPVDHTPQGKRKLNKKNIDYKYGNYNRYYGYRNPNHNDDARLQFLRRDIFEGKDVLDIGCNVGNITLIVAKDLGARSIVGLDIDKKLIEVARSNIRHFIGNTGPRNKHRGNGGGRHPMHNPMKEMEEKFPTSMPIVYGPIDAGLSHIVTRFSKMEKRHDVKTMQFPHNVKFVQGNYVLDCDSLLETEQPKFDVILCLSVTKWIHLNWGDDGLKRAFHRMFAQLRPGGKLILEPQAWASYRKKKNITETIAKNYHSISLFPQKFTQYLLSEVGFKKCEVLGMPQHPSKGFQRPIQLFYKEGSSPARGAEEEQEQQSAFQSSDDASVKDRTESDDRSGNDAVVKEDRGIAVDCSLEIVPQSEEIKGCEVKEPERDQQSSCSLVEEGVVKETRESNLKTDASPHRVESCESKSDNVENDSRSDSGEGVGGGGGKSMEVVTGEPCASKTVEEESLISSDVSMESSKVISPKDKGEIEHSEVSL